ncbi:RES family NAD+ phosphorylase [Mesorhizobium sp. M0571]|uniref:RES family NAD+ phosphorylase n=1 Tax=Mesorhizobium sp. M0571 TaxID=2956960 RepID=UPI003334B937
MKIGFRGDAFDKRANRCTGNFSPTSLKTPTKRRTGIGIIYPSVRHQGSICLAAFYPDFVQNLRQGGIWRLEWQGSSLPTVINL